MENISFRIKPHSRHHGVQIVEILLNGLVVGSIYPQQGEATIKIISVHMAEKEIDPNFAGIVVNDDGLNFSPQIPSVKITFRPSPWILTQDGKVFKHNN